MVPDFQSHLLKFIFQDRRAKKYIHLLDSTIFDLGSQEQVFEWLRDYLNRYNTTPSKVNFIEFVNRQIERSKVTISDEVQQSLRNVISQAYSPWQGDIGLLEEVLIEEMQKKQTKDLFKEYADQIKLADPETFVKIHMKMGKIVKLKQDGLDAAKSSGRFIVKDKSKFYDEITKGQPIVFNAINAMTGAGGFYTPQLITLMAGPKTFKTGILLTIAIDLLKKGKKILYVDFENGEANIAIRIKQALLECKRSEVFKYKNELNTILTFIEKLGGDIRVEKFNKGTTLDQVEAKMLEIKDEYNFVPDTIIWDYLKLAKSADRKLSSTDQRLQIQDIFHHAIDIQHRWQCWGITVSPVKASAINKLIIDVQDFGEDSHQAYNCHAAFALCRTKTEMREGTARMVSVVQREGAPYRGDIASVCALRFDEANMKVEELDAETYMLTMQESLEEDSKIAKKAQQFRRNLNITDD